ncbi:hypothetical protein [Sphingobium aromaticiconvertens]|uniref:hypothetical protein n=1 Tax=Sphingobium aromaticiconvertens TaxID=365341 RepID=UPI00301A006C
MAAYLDERAGKGAEPESLCRYRESIAKIHQMLDLKDPTQAELDTPKTGTLMLPLR